MPMPRTHPAHPAGSGVSRKPPSAPHHAVFFDPTGRRWWGIKTAFLLLLALIITLITVSWGPIQRPPAVRGAPPTLPLSPPTIQGRAPTIGVGPLIRLVRVERDNGALIAVDPVTRRTLGPITGDDADTVGSASFAMQRYGYSAAAHKTLELTFDDGPDPTWTPQILDLLAKYKVPATFFVVGSEVVKYPDIVQREVQEGFAIGNHSLTHPDLKPDQVAQEFVSTDHIIRAVTGIGTNLVRLPYDGYAGRTADADRNGVMVNAERLGYIVSQDEFDTNDWMYGNPARSPKTPIPLPPTTADNLTILLHDGGGNRAATVEYLERLIPWARAHGYQFYTLPQVSPQVVAGASHVTPSIWDYETLVMYQALWSWPSEIISALFALAVLSVIVGGCVNMTLAIQRRIRYRRRFPSAVTCATGPPVSVAIAAYNEAKVIGRTLDALRRSRYEQIIEIIVVDDGSTDSTTEVVSQVAALDPRIRLLRQENQGKATALNRAFYHAQSSAVITLDADTIFTPDTVGALARYFAEGGAEKLGAVAGVVKVGNLRNLLTRWQALEYVTQVGVERGAQDAMGAIMVTPGACAAWNRDAVLNVGGFSHSTLAEDCDLALDLQRAGYRITQDDEAVSYTEAPETVGALKRQRFRWMYGNIQAMWKHRRMILNPRYGWLGMVTLPMGALSILAPLVFLPFVYAMAIVTYLGQGLNTVLLYVGLFMLAQAIIATVGVGLMRERPTLLLVAPVYQLIYEPLRAYILYKSALTVLQGARTRWNKLQRTGAVAATYSGQADAPRAARPVAQPEDQPDTVSGQQTLVAHPRAARTQRRYLAMPPQLSAIVRERRRWIRMSARLRRAAPTRLSACLPPEEGASRGAGQ
jgi:cellulose synthase/poly-beta-1,6-N-acetylglucosamine synthase-like glycosyltransferase/peptidoglycan/xylan/chitin deacetylase (PgdA/CDA1 family)